MKKFILAVAVSLMSVSAFAFETNYSSQQGYDQEEYATAADLPPGSIIDALVENASGRPRCPRGQLVAKKYCWSWKRFSFKHCGYFCHKPPPPPRGGQH